MRPISDGKAKVNCCPVCASLRASNFARDDFRILPRPNFRSAKLAFAFSIRHPHFDL
jgi:hypothetical protein